MYLKIRNSLAIDIKRKYLYRSIMFFKFKLMHGLTSNLIKIMDGKLMGLNQTEITSGCTNY